MRALEVGQRPAGEPEPGEERGGGRRARVGQRERHEPDAVDVEAAPARPGERLGQPAETTPARRREPVARVQQTESSRAPEPEEDGSGVRFAEDQLDLGGDSLARER